MESTTTELSAARSRDTWALVNGVFKKAFRTLPTINVCEAAGIANPMAINKKASRQTLPRESAFLMPYFVKESFTNWSMKMLSFSCANKIVGIRRRIYNKVCLIIRYLVVVSNFYRLRCAVSTADSGRR